MKQLYMVEFELPKMFAKEFIARMPEQQKEIDLLMNKGVIKMCSFAQNHSKQWLIARGKSEFEIMALISKLPLSNFMIPSISPLMFHCTTPKTASQELALS